jgi:lactoylglutathione lyase
LLFATIQVTVSFFVRSVLFSHDTTDGYWIELVRRTPGSPWAGLAFSFAQTMLRVKDPKLSLSFYVDTLGMRLQLERHYGAEAGDFSLYFLQDSSQIEAAHSDEAHAHLNASFHPALELTHNHGTELDPSFAYHDGNSDPRGFGQDFFSFFFLLLFLFEFRRHIGFLVDDIDGFFARAEQLGVRIKKRPSEGMMRRLGFLYDSDGYWIEIIERGATFDQILGIDK